MKSRRFLTSRFHISRAAVHAKPDAIRVLTNRFSFTFFFFFLFRDAIRVQPSQRVPTVHAMRFGRAILSISRRASSRGRVRWRVPPPLSNAVLTLRYFVRFSVSRGVAIRSYAVFRSVRVKHGYCVYAFRDFLFSFTHSIDIKISWARIIVFFFPDIFR